MTELANKLREKGLKVTPQRLAIYHMLLHTDEHPNAETIYHSLVADNPTMSLATVYKTMDYFKQLGLVQELNVGDSCSHYDANVNCHPHVVCLSCGKVSDLYCEDLTDIFHKSSCSIDFQVAYEQLILYGTCHACKAN